MEREREGLIKKMEREGERVAGRKRDRSERERERGGGGGGSDIWIDRLEKEILCFGVDIER